MILIGCDLASYKSGIFILDIENIKFKSILLDIKGTQEERIRKIHIESKKIFNKYNPDIIIIESTYLDSWDKHKKGTKKRGNINTLKILEKCHGAVISATNDLSDIFYMEPTVHKELVAGIGNADKKATIWSVQKILGKTLSSDESDAAALVLAYLIKKQQWEILDNIKNKFKS